MLFEKIQLEAGEQILMVVRKHWFIIVTELIATFLMALFPFFILIAYTLVPFDDLLPTIHAEDLIPLIVFSMAGWYVLVFIVGYMIWTHYYLDVWVVTDRRLIVINQVHFFNRTVGSFRLERLQDMTVSIEGILHTFLNFGNIRAQTAGADDSGFAMNGLPDPRGVLATIQKATDERLKAVRS